MASVPAEAAARPAPPNPPDPSTLATPSSSSSSSSSPPNGGKKGKMSVGDFVSASFARFEEEYGTNSTNNGNNTTTHKLNSNNNNNSHNNNNNNNNNNGRRHNNSDEENDDQQDNNTTKTTTNNNNNDDDEYYTEEPFLFLLLTLYLPLLLLGIRRTTFGTAHLLFQFLRSLLLGHLLRFLLSVVVFSIPPSVATYWNTKCYSKGIYEWYARGVMRMEVMWESVTRIYWVQHVLWALTGDGRYHPSLGSGGINHNIHNHSHVIHNTSGIDGISHSTGGGGALNSSGSGGGGLPSRTKGLNPDKVWPPPALTLLTLITVVAFVVHPDGLTWIMVGKFFDGLLYFFQLCSLCLGMMKDGTIPTLAASAVLAGLVLFGGLIHRTLSSKSPKHYNGGDDSASANDGSNTNTNTNNSTRFKHKKGKKGRNNGRHHHHNHQRGKVRGGHHYRSTKDNNNHLYDGSPTRRREGSQSKSPSSLLRKVDDSEISNDNSDGLIRKELVDGAGRDGFSQDTNNTLVKETIDGKAAPRYSQSQSQDNLVSKNRPYSVDSVASVPQFSDDVSSCSSITGSLLDAPVGTTKQYKSNAGEGSVKSLAVTESGGNRRRKRGGKRGKSNVPLSVSNNDGGTTNATAPAASSSTGTFSHNNTYIPAPPGFVAKDLSMTPLRVSPLPVLSTSTSPPRCVAPSPTQKPICRPNQSTRSFGNNGVVGRENSNFHSFSYDVAGGGRPYHPALRNRASSDGVMKQHGQSTSSPNIAPIGTSSLNLQPPNQPPGIIRYGFPNYSAYAHSDGRYAPGKIELAAFLAQVGLVGSACAQILADLFDVDSLAALTPEQFYCYNIVSEKQMEIKALLEARRLRLQQQKQHTAPAVLRPPPGFKSDGFNGLISSPTSGFGATATTNPTVSPIRPFSHAYTFAPDHSSSFLLPPVSKAQNGSNITLTSLTNNTDSSFLGSADPIIKPMNSGISRPFSIGQSLFPSSHGVEMETDDDKIDADLQQLGDRMVGSVLDF